MLDAIITSKTRVRILMRLFMNPDSQAYLRELVGEFGTSPGHLKQELQQLSDAGLLASTRQGRQVNYRANRAHPLFKELSSMVRKTLGMDKVLDSIVERLGNLELAIVVGDYAEGRDTGVIDLVLVGAVDQANLVDLTAKTERYIQRRIRHLTLGRAEFAARQQWLDSQPHLVIWSAGGRSE